MKYLIVNADDYNLTESVSRGIIDTSINGIVTSTTFMANLPFSYSNPPLFLPSNPAFGIHFNFTFGKPVSHKRNVSALVNEKGEFYRSFLNEVKKDVSSQIRLELEAQYEKFLSLGIKPTHFDSHHHFHTKDSVKDVFFEFAIEKNIPMRSLNGFHREMVAEKNIITPDYFYESFYGEEATVSHLTAILKSLPDGVCELMCHPGYRDALLDKCSSYSERRERELRILTDETIVSLIKALGIKLINYSDLSDIYGN